MVVPNLVGQALRGEPLTVFGTGEQTRCFSSVFDIVPALVHIAESTEAYGKAFNLGGAREISIVDLARAIIQVTGSTSEVRLVPYANAYGEGYEDMQRRVPDNSRAHRLVKFVPTTTVESIIRSVAESLRTSVDGDDWVMTQSRPDPSTTVVVA
jgi:UDP-glucose 4-epimerase